MLNHERIAVTSFLSICLLLVVLFQFVDTSAAQIVSFKNTAPESAMYDLDYGVDLRITSESLGINHYFLNNQEVFLDSPENPLIVSDSLLAYVCTEGDKSLVLIGSDGSETYFRSDTEYNLRLYNQSIMLTTDGGVPQYVGGYTWLLRYSDAGEYCITNIDGKCSLYLNSINDLIVVNQIDYNGCRSLSVIFNGHTNDSQECTITINKTRDLNYSYLYHCWNIDISYDNANVVNSYYFVKGIVKAEQLPTWGTYYPGMFAFIGVVTVGVFCILKYPLGRV